MQNIEKKEFKNFFAENKILIIKFIFFVIFVVVIALFIRSSNITSLEEFKTIIRSEREKAPLTYMIAFAILPTFFAPITPMAIAAGFVFGTWEAFLYTAISAFVNSTITFFLAKYFVSELVKKVAMQKHKEVYDKIISIASDREGFALMAVLRLLPFVPYTFLNYMGGALNYKYFVFIFSTMVGIIPGMYLYVNIGANADNIKSPKFIFAIALLLVFWVFVSIIVKKFYTKHFKAKK